MREQLGHRVERSDLCRENPKAACLPASSSREGCCKSSKFSWEHRSLWWFMFIRAIRVGLETASNGEINHRGSNSSLASRILHPSPPVTWGWRGSHPTDHPWMHQILPTNAFLAQTGAGCCPHLLPCTARDVLCLPQAHLGLRSTWTTQKGKAKDQQQMQELYLINC